MDSFTDKGRARPRRTAAVVAGVLAAAGIWVGAPATAAQARPAVDHSVTTTHAVRGDLAAGRMGTNDWSW